MDKSKDKRNKNKKTPYESSARSTRSSTRASTSKGDKSSQDIARSTDMEPIVELQDIIVNQEAHSSQGPSWNDFNLLKRSVDEMHSLLKSLNVNTNAIGGNNETNVDRNDGFVVDNHIQVTQGLPREAENVPMIVNFRDNNESNKDLRNANKNDNAASNTIQMSVNGFLDSIANSSKPTGEVIYREPGRPIDLKVTDKQKQKIWGDQFIELATLLDPQVHSETEFTIVSKPGEPLHFGQSKNLKSINNLGQWCTAFEIFISVYCQKTPTAISPLLTYMNTIKTLAHRDGDYLLYDREFRMMKETNNIPWDLVHNGLWLECRDVRKNSRNSYKNKNNNTNDSFRSKNSQGKQNQTKHPFGYCFRYHTYGKCGRASCMFNHSCYECKDEKHPIFKCPKQTNKGSSENNNK